MRPQSQTPTKRLQLIGRTARKSGDEERRDVKQAAENETSNANITNPKTEEENRSLQKRTVGDNENTFVFYNRN